MGGSQIFEINDGSFLPGVPEDPNDEKTAGNAGNIEHFRRYGGTHVTNSPASGDVPARQPERAPSGGWHVLWKAR